MADYRLNRFGGVIRTADEAFIPDNPSNTDRVRYEAWLAGGGVPNPYVPPPEPVPAITKRQALLYLLSRRKAESDVETAIETIQWDGARAATQIEWRYPSGPLRHDHPLIVALAPAIGLSVEELPDAFRAAAKL
jgi:hypothetical protein